MVTDTFTKTYQNRPLSPPVLPTWRSIQAKKYLNHTSGVCLGVCCKALRMAFFMTTITSVTTMPTIRITYGAPCSLTQTQSEDAPWPYPDHIFKRMRKKKESLNK